MRQDKCNSRTQICHVDHQKWIESTREIICSSPREERVGNGDTGSGRKEQRLCLMFCRNKQRAHGGRDKLEDESNDSVVSGYTYVTCPIVPHSLVRAHFITMPDAYVALYCKVWSAECGETLVADHAIPIKRHRQGAGNGGWSFQTADSSVSMTHGTVCVHTRISMPRRIQ